MLFQAFMTTVPKHVINKIQKAVDKKGFFWNNSSPKVKHETICNDYKAERLKNFEIPNKIIALQCSSIRRLYDILS